MVLEFVAECLWSLNRGYFYDLYLICYLQMTASNLSLSLPLPFSFSLFLSDLLSVSKDHPPIYLKSNHNGIGLEIYWI